MDRGWGNLSIMSNCRKNTATDLQSVLVDASHLYTAPSTVLTKDFYGPSSEARLAHTEGESLAAQDIVPDRIKTKKFRVEGVHHQQYIGSRSLESTEGDGLIRR